MLNENRSEWNPFGAATWVAWLGATLLAVVTLVSGAYATFDTKEAAHDRELSVIQRLDRMETKVDRVLEQTR